MHPNSSKIDYSISNNQSINHLNIHTDIIIFYYVVYLTRVLLIITRLFFAMLSFKKKEKKKKNKLKYNLKA